MYDFSGKVALVTGSSSGIGAAIATQLAQYGAKVVITGRNAESLEKVASQIAEISNGVEALQIIGSLEEDAFPLKLITETIDKFGQLDILVNNAALSSFTGNLGSATCMEEFDALFKVNVRVPVELIQLAVPYLEVTKGNIVNISSVAGSKPVPNMLIYSATKAAIEMISKCAALELAPKGIRVNTIVPGPVATEIFRSIEDAEVHKQTIAAFKASTALDRIAEPEEIASLVTFVVSESARNITGAAFFSDSGMSLK